MTDVFFEEAQIFFSICKHVIIYVANCSLEFTFFLLMKRSQLHTKELNSKVYLIIEVRGVFMLAVVEVLLGDR